MKSTSSRPMCQVVLHGVLVGKETQLTPLQVTPADVEVELNDYRTADTFRVTLKWQTFPFDPRQWTALGIDIYLGPAGNNGQLALSADTLMLSGLVDRPQLRAGDNGVELSLEGRDFTALFTDWRWSTTLKRGTLTSMAQQVIEQVAGAAAMRVTLLGIDNLDLSGGKSQWSPAKDSDAWTVMTGLARLAGAVVYVRGNEVVFSGPRNLFPADAAPTLLWGSDLSSLEYGTEIVGGKKQGVKVISRDPVTGAVNSVLFPSSSKKTVVKSNRRGTVQTEHFVEWVLSGVPKAYLSTVAERIYELQARNQVKGTLETHRLETLDGRPLWKLSHSSAVRIVPPTERAGELASSPLALGQLTSGAFRMSPEVAQAFIQAARALQAVQTPFYVQKARHRWSASTGYSLGIDFINFVQV